MTAKFGKSFNKKKYCPCLEPKRILTLINLAMLGLGISYLQHADVAQASEIGKVNTYKNANSLKTNQLLELTKNGKTTKEVCVDVKTETHSQASKSNDTNKRADSNQASRLLKKIKIGLSIQKLLRTIGH